MAPDGPRRPPTPVRPRPEPAGRPPARARQERRPGPGRRLPGRGRATADRGFSPYLWVGAAALLVALLAFVWPRSPGDSPAKDTQAVSSPNTPPEIQSLEIAVTETDIIARPQGRDPDGDRFRFQYRWLVSGKPQRARGALLPRNRVVPGDTVEVEATPVDRHGARGRPMRSSLSIEAKRP